MTWHHENKEEEDDRIKIEGKSLLHDFKVRKDSRQSQVFLFAQETEVMVRRVLMGLLQAWNHGFHVCLFPSPLHAYVHMYYVGALRWIEKSRFVALSLRSLLRFYCFSCFTLPCKS